MKKAIFEYQNDMPIMRCNMPGCKFIYYVDFHNKKYLLAQLLRARLSKSDIDAELELNDKVRRRAFAIFTHHQCTWRY